MNYREIARKLEISPSALSIIVNHKPGVSDATRQRVIAELQEMGLAHLIKDTEQPAPTPVQSQTLCFLLYKKTGQFLDQHAYVFLLLESIEKEAARHGYHVMIATISSREGLSDGIRRIRGMNPAGIIVFATEMDNEDMLPLLDLSIPIVAMDNDLTTLDCDTVSIDNYMGTYQAIQYLVQNGHKRIGYLKSSDRINSFDERDLGYRAALEQFHLHFLPEDIVMTRYTEGESYQDIKAYLAGSPSLPDAFVTDDDTIAAGAIRALSEHGIHVPHDVSIIGFNDRPLCEISTPAITTINIAVSSLTAASVNALMELIHLPNNTHRRAHSRKICIGTQLIERQSVSNQNG